MRRKKERVKRECISEEEPNKWKCNESEKLKTGEGVLNCKSESVFFFLEKEEELRFLLFHSHS